MMAFPAQLPDLHRPSLGRKSFAIPCTLTLLGNASYPISVRQLAVSLPLLSAAGSRSQPCGSLGSLRPASQRTCTSESSFMLGTQGKPQSGAAAIIQLCGAVRTTCLGLAQGYRPHEAIQPLFL
jgi:hypothetical protein